LDTELLKIETEILYPTVRGVAFESLSAKPDKYREGTLAYGLAGVFGGQEGLYIYDGSGNWRKL
jgi:hypothetical protein